MLVVGAVVCQKSVRVGSGEQGLTGSRYPTRPDLFFNYPTRPVPKIENDRVAGNKYFILTAIWHSIGWEMQPTKWWIQLILAQKIIFGHLLKYLSKMDLSAVFTPALSDYHLFRRPLHGSLHRSCIAEVYPTLELICEFRPSKFSHYPSRPVPLPEVFVTTRPDPVPKSKTTTRQSLVITG